MLLSRSRSLCLRSGTRFIATSSLSPNILRDINAQDTRHGKVCAAIDNHLFALAALIALKNPPVQLGLIIQQKLLRGLIDYHPRLTPINLIALRRLHNHYNFEVQSIDKALLVRTLLEYGDQRLFRSGLDFLVSVQSGPIPISSLVFLVEYAAKRNAPEICEALWDYTESVFPYALLEHTSIMVDLMTVFSRAEKNHLLAKRIARIGLKNASNPSIALGIANVAYKTCDEELMLELQKSVGFVMTRSIEGVVAQLKAKVSKPIPTMEFNAQELSGIVKATASRDIKEAESITSALAEEDERVKIGAEGHLSDHDNHTQAFRDLDDPKVKKLLTNIALCNQYIADNSFDKFLETLTNIRKLRNIEGIILNLKIKWELVNGDFYHAKRHYQNFRNIPYKQRSIALATICQMASDDAQRQWVAAEQRRLESQGLTPARR